MRPAHLQRCLIRAAIVLAGSSFFLNGCDPGIRTTVENGIISTTQAGLASFFQALLQVANEQNNAA